MCLEWSTSTEGLLANIKSAVSACQWNSTSFTFSLIIEGTTEKVLQFMVQTIKNILIGHEYIFLMTFSELPP